MEYKTRESRILDKIRDACFELDRMGTVLFVNKKAEQIVGLKKEAMLHRNIWDILSGDRSSPAFNTIQVNALDHKKHASSKYLSAVSRTWISLEAIPDENGCVVLFYEAEGNNKEKSSVEQKLSHVNELLELKNAVFEYAEEIARVGSWIWNPETNESIYSDNMFRLFGMQPNEMEPDFDAISLFLHPDDRKKVLDFSNEVKEGNDPIAVEYRVKRKDGEERIFRNRIRIVHDHIGVPVFVGVTEDITEAKKTEEKLRIQSKEILNTIILTQEQERERIGEALHNGVAQLLYGIQTRLQLVRSDDKQQIKELLDIITEAINDIKRISFELVPVVLKDHGIEVAIRSLLQRMTMNKPLVELQVQKFRERLPEKTEFAIYRIVQELLNNCVKHAKASKVEICLKQNKKGLLLEVNDNGVGFDPKKIKVMDKGIGLQSIKNRIKLLDGRLKIHSSPEGTKVLIRIPLHHVTS